MIDVVLALKRWLVGNECPVPVVADKSVRACIDGNHCGCDNMTMRRALDEIERLRAEVATLTADIEQGYMAGAYARLQNLQQAESALDALRKRVEKSAVGNVIRINYFGREQAAVYVTAPDGFIGERVALVVLD